MINPKEKTQNNIIEAFKEANGAKEESKEVITGIPRKAAFPKRKQIIIVALIWLVLPIHFKKGKRSKSIPIKRAVTLKKLIPINSNLIGFAVRFPKIKAGNPMYKAKSPIGLSQL